MKATLWEIFLNLRTKPHHGLWRMFGSCTLSVTETTTIQKGENVMFPHQGIFELPSIECLVDELHKCRRDGNIALAHRLCLAAHAYGLHEVVGNYLVPMLVESGNQSDGLRVFQRLADRNEFSWTSLIQGFIDNGESEKAFSLYGEMRKHCVQASIFTLQSLVKASSQIKCVEKGRALHAEIVKEEFENDLIVGNTLIDMYAKCGLFREAWAVFMELHIQDSVSWNALITGYAECGFVEEALNCITQMEMDGVPLDDATFICGLKSCKCIGALERGRALHAEIIKGCFEVYSGVGNSLIDLYARCDSLMESQDVFNELTVQDIVSWNTLIAGYAEHGYCEEALIFFEQMQYKGIPPNAVTFLSCLKCCSSLRAMSRTQDLHTRIIEKGFEKHSSIGNLLVDTYAKCGSMVEAWNTFKNLPVQDVVSWTSLISGYAEQGLGNKGLECWEQMLLNDVSPNAVTYFCSLKNCSLVGCLEKGLEIHLSIVGEGLEKDSYVASALVDMYVKCGSFIEAEDVLEEIPVQDVIHWTALISGYVEQGHCADALRTSERMLSEQVSPNSVTLLCCMKACSSMQVIVKGQELHTWTVKAGLEKDHFISNAIIDMYAKCGSILESRELFDQLEDYSVVSWNAIISGYADNGFGDDVLDLFEEMQAKGLVHNDITLVCVLKGCGSVGALEKGHQTHSEVVKRGYEGNIFVGNTLIDMYAKCGLLNEAQSLFDKWTIADVVSWNALILGYAEQGHEVEALNCFERMHHAEVSPNSVTYLCTLKNCAAIAAMDHGQRIHAAIVKTGFDSYPYLGNILVDLYIKCGYIVEATHIFNKLPERDLIVWTALISGYAECGLNSNALEYLDMMQEEGVSPSTVTFLCSLKGCGNFGAINGGQKLHSAIITYGFDDDPAIGSALVDMYAKASMLLEALDVFLHMSLRLLVAWTSLITAYAEHGIYEEVLDCFEKMQFDSLSPDAIAYLSSLKACGALGALYTGQDIHSDIIKQGVDTDEFVEGALVDMYAKCGLLKEAWDVFDKLPSQTVVSWTALIAGFAFQGQSESVFHLLEIMKNEGIEPDEITLLNVLTVCSHAGLVEHGCEFFQFLTKGCGVDPTVEHHNCLLDLFSRAGQLNESVTMVEDMPIQPNFITYRTVLGACKKWGHVELGRHAFDCALCLDEEQSTSFVLMSNIYVLTDSNETMLL